jgi:lysozyme
MLTKSAHGERSKKKRKLTMSQRKTKRKKRLPRVVVLPGLSGLDVSYVQKVVDWTAVKASGIQFAFIKATEGEGLKDSFFDENRAGAKAAGLPVGFYHFFRPLLSMQMQIDNFVKVVGKLESGDLYPVLDIEAPEDWTRFSVAAANQLIDTWLTAVEKALGVRPLLYINLPMAQKVLGSSPSRANDVLYLAQYPDVPTAQPPQIPAPWKDWTFWQHSDKGTNPGITGNVDLDRFNGTAADLSRYTVT